MTLEDYMMEVDVQSWLDAHGYESMGVYPTGEPFVEIEGTTYTFDVTPDEFQQLLQDSVEQDQDFITPHRVEDDQDEDSLVLPVI